MPQQLSQHLVKNNSFGCHKHGWKLSQGLLKNIQWCANIFSLRLGCSHSDILSRIDVTSNWSNQGFNLSPKHIQHAAGPATFWTVWPPETQPAHKVMVQTTSLVTLFFLGEAGHLHYKSQHEALQEACLHVLLCNEDLDQSCVATCGRGVQWRPQFVVLSVDAGSSVQQDLHHLLVVVDTTL